MRLLGRVGERRRAARQTRPPLSPLVPRGARESKASVTPQVREQGQGEGAIEADLARLLALGLWEVYEDLHDAQTPALALNALVRPLAGTLNDAEETALAGAVTGALFKHWGGETDGKQRGWSQDHELARLGLLARDARVLAATGADALRFLDNQFQYQRAAAWAKAMLAIMDAAGAPASVDLLRTAAERCQQVGDVAEANAFRERAMKLIGQGGETDAEDHAATLLTNARALVDQGQPDEALRHLEQAKKLLPPGRDQAVMLGEIARIRADKGEVDAALQLHQERLPIYAAMGDVVGVGNALWSMAQIEMQHENWQDAFDHLRESYELLTKAGRLDGICMVGLSLGQLLCEAGQREQGLAILTRSRDGFQKLGQAQMAQQTQALLDQLSQSPPRA